MRQEVTEVIRTEVGTGQGSNFVVKRSLTARIADFRIARALGIFQRLLVGERGAYWTFLVHVAGTTFVGATPERHISVRDRTVTMNPISGTYRHPSTGPDLTGLLSFLEDSKETDELFMVVDEELKMMSRICERGVVVQGPFLRGCCGTWVGSRCALLLGGVLLRFRWGRGVRCVRRRGGRP
ncbi:hypothetical protein DMP23_20010 [Amycolatopsis sp. A1MSW2902]